MTDDVSKKGTRYGVLFDVDGTLVDSNYQHTMAWWQAFRRFDHDVPMVAINRAIGMGGRKLIEHLLGTDRDQEQDAELEATHGAVFASYWPGLRAFKGSAELLHRCADEGLIVVLASSASKQDLNVLRGIIDADRSITAATCSDDAENTKPSPDILEAALASGGFSAENAVCVGDSVWDVFAASELAVPTIGVASGGTSEAELREAGAVEVYKDIQTLLNAFDDGVLHNLATGSSSPPNS
ncbi:HAD family hydrolase [Paeniglutamicibacter antarcticus]|uniref:HAD family hydrolase n=1 Tax=Paeniglutamicibacter antarcticus TaxID=494023 RepID=A0ABP9TKI5_9MICC